MNDIGIYVGAWYSVSSTRRLDLYEILRHPKVVGGALQLGIRNIEDNEELSTAAGPYKVSVRVWRIDLYPSDKGEAVAVAMGVKGFTELCNGLPISMHDPDWNDQVRFGKYNKLMTAMFLHPAVLFWRGNSGILPIIEG